MRRYQPFLFSRCHASVLALCLAVAACDADPGAGDAPSAERGQRDDAAVAPGAPPDALERSRALATQLGGELKSELQQALAQSGPAAAVTVCRERAPAIAARLSAESGARVGRTSLRVRNPSNRPQAWQIDVLREFDLQAPLNGEQPPPEHHAAPADGAESFRYLRAIPTGGMCLTCHGRTLAPDVQAALEADYPRDQATGYDAGDVRGAFVVTWPRQL